ncbi:TolC family protein [bacterium]|nr:TolC family protein [bacterium]
MRTILVLLVVVVLALAANAQSQQWTVADAVIAARDHHPTYIEAAAILDQAKGARRSSLSLDSPSFSVEFEGIPEGAGVNTYEERRLALFQEIDFPLRYFWQIKKQNALVGAAEFQQQLLLMDLEREVRSAYLEAWFADERLAVLERYAASLDTQALTFRQMRDVGRIADLDVSRAEAEAAEVRSDLRISQSDQSAARARLENLTGYTTLPTKLANPLQSNWVPPIDGAVWANNFDLLSARKLADAADNDQTLAATSWLPSLEIGGFRQHVPSAVEGSDYWGFEVGLSVPLWYLWGGIGEIEVATAQKRSAWASVGKRQLELNTEWQESFAQLQAVRERLNTFEQVLIPTSENVKRLALRSYQAGKASYLDVLEAQRSMLQRQLGYLETTRDLESIHIALDQLAGKSIVASNTEPMER